MLANIRVPGVPGKPSGEMAPQVEIVARYHMVHEFDQCYYSCIFYSLHSLQTCVCTIL